MAIGLPHQGNKGTVALREDTCLQILTKMPPRNNFDDLLNHPHQHTNLQDTQMSVKIMTAGAKSDQEPHRLLLIVYNELDSTLPRLQASSNRP